jgi:hypothetical protein
MAEDATPKQGGTTNHLRITDEDWGAMCDRRDDLDKDIEDALSRKSIRMAAIAINDRAHLSASLKKAHNMRERDRLATYRKRLDDLKQDLTAAGETVEEDVAS